MHERNEDGEKHRSENSPADDEREVPQTRDMSRLHSGRRERIVLWSGARKGGYAAGCKRNVPPGPRDAAGPRCPAAAEGMRGARSFHAAATILGNISRGACFVPRLRPLNE